MLSFFLLRFLGPGAISLLSGNALSFWFHRRLGTVEGLRQVGTACAMAVIPVGYLWLFNQFGWRGAYASLGGIVVRREPGLRGGECVNAVRRLCVPTRKCRK